MRCSTRFGTSDVKGSLNFSFSHRRLSLQTDKQQAIDVILQYVRYPLTLTFLLADFGAQLTTVDSCNRLFNSAVQLTRLFHNDFIAQATTLNAEQNAAMLQRLDRCSVYRYVAGKHHHLQSCADCFGTPARRISYER